MAMNEKTKFRAGLVAAIGTATFVAIGVSAQTGGGGGSVGAPGVTATVSPSPSVSVSPSPGVSPSTSPSASPSASSGTVGAAVEGPRQVYSAVLNPVNGSGASGTVTVVVDQGRIGAMVQASGLAPSMMHAMHIHQGTACADISADVNGDGVIDAVEAEAVSGQPIIPLSLSGDLSASTPQAAAGLIYPKATAGGALNYINAGSASQALTGRVVEIHGVSPSTSLPSSVVSDDPGQTPQQTLGVACGVLVPATE